MINFFDTASIKDEYDMVIIGGGAAGCTAAMYAARDELSVLVLEKTAPGGQMGITAHIDNHPGFPETVTGSEMAEKYHQQAARFGATFRYGFCMDIKIREDSHKEIYIDGREAPIIAKTLVIATGCTPKKLDVPGENKFWGRGVSTCATCDGGFYKDKVVAAVGGGNTALEESAYLTRFAKKVYLIHRRDEFRGTKICQRAVYENPNIELVLESVVTEIRGENTVTGITVKHVKTGETRDMEIDGIFIFIGQTPSAEPFNKLISTDEEGFLIADEHMECGLPGVFVAGDIRSKEFRQIATAASDGVIAAKMAVKYLQNLEMMQCGVTRPEDPS